MWLLNENALNNKQFFEINNHVFRIYGGNMKIKSHWKFFTFNKRQ